MRIASLLPSATEIVAALGLETDLVGVSHCCDFPPTVRSLPRVTATAVNTGADSACIDRQVRELVAAGQPLYTIDEALLAALAPDLVVTQGLCDVCAVPATDVNAAIARLGTRIRTVNLEPSSLAEVLAAIDAIGAATGVGLRARCLTSSLRTRINAVASRTSAIPATERPRTTLLDWLEPTFAGGHWIAEMIRLAGGEPVLCPDRQPSTQVTISALDAAHLQALVIAPCGHTADRAAADAGRWLRRDSVASLPAIRTGQVHIIDGNALFNRPGPRLVDSLELLAHLLHPARHPMPPLCWQTDRPDRIIADLDWHQENATITVI